jgi:hypothetical protein
VRRFSTEDVMIRDVRAGAIPEIRLLKKAFRHSIGRAINRQLTRNCHNGNDRRYAADMSDRE